MASPFYQKQREAAIGNVARRTTVRIFEYDNASEAPICIGEDNTTRFKPLPALPWEVWSSTAEVAPDQGIHTFYDTSPPEVIDGTTSPSAGAASGKDAKVLRRSHKKLIVAVASIGLLVLIGTVIGLGLWLSKRGSDRDAILTSKASLPLQMLEGTSIAALALPNGDRKDVLIFISNVVIRQGSEFRGGK
ncbi:MAG: hypothetical protein Q9174_001000 [Haloplaca sp. 1 TL-2023]